MTARGEATRARLVAATQQVVREVGYANATTRAVADAAGVSEGTIYRHFPDKLTLFLAAAREGNDAVVESVERLPDRAGTRTVEQNLTDALLALATLRDAVLPLELAVLTDPDLAARRQELLATTSPQDVPGPHRPLAAYLRAEQTAGRVRPDVEPDHAAVTVLATLLGAAILGSGSPSGPTAEQIGTAVRLLVHGLQGS